MLNKHLLLLNRLNVVNKTTEKLKSFRNLMKMNFYEKTGVILKSTTG